MAQKTKILAFLASVCPIVGIWICMRLFLEISVLQWEIVCRWEDCALDPIFSCTQLASCFTYVHFTLLEDLPITQEIIFCWFIEGFCIRCNYAIIFGPITSGILLRHSYQCYRLWGFWQHRTWSHYKNCTLFCPSTMKCARGI